MPEKPTDRGERVQPVVARPLKPGEAPGEPSSDEPADDQDMFGMAYEEKGMKDVPGRTIRKVMPDDHATMIRKVMPERPRERR